jgi:hypothetical protein
MSNNLTENGGTHAATCGQHRAKATDLAWLAGIVDGEGHISLYRNQRGYLCVKTHVEVTMSNLACVEKARDIIWAITHRKYPIKERRQPHLRHVSFSLRIMDQKGCRKVCEALLPYLVAKRELAELMIEFCETRKQARGEPGRQVYGIKEYALINMMQRALDNAYTAPLPRVETEREAPATAEA